jgi:hypothetical protein
LAVSAVKKIENLLTEISHSAGWSPLSAAHQFRLHLRRFVNKLFVENGEGGGLGRHLVLAVFFRGNMWSAILAGFSVETRGPRFWRIFFRGNTWFAILVDIFAETRGPRFWWIFLRKHVVRDFGGVFRGNTWSAILEVFSVETRGPRFNSA